MSQSGSLIGTQKKLDLHGMQHVQSFREQGDICHASRLMFVIRVQPFSKRIAIAQHNACYDITACAHVRTIVHKQSSLQMETCGTHCFDAVMDRLANQIVLEAKISISTILNGRIGQAIADSQALEVDALLNRHMLVVAENSMRDSWHIVSYKDMVRVSMSRLCPHQTSQRHD